MSLQSLVFPLPPTLALLHTTLRCMPYPGTWLSPGLPWEQGRKTDARGADATTLPRVAALRKFYFAPNTKEIELPRVATENR